MKTTGYDQAGAGRLVPLLRSIVHEICERRHWIETLEARLDHLSKFRHKRAEFYDARARLSAHRRELRHAEEELSQLGCELDPTSPTRVLIPGDDGELEHGFTWVADEDTACGYPHQLAS